MILQLDIDGGVIDYFGPTVNKTARVEGMGYGGQVLITSDVLEQIDEKLTDYVTEDVGTHLLKVSCSSAVADMHCAGLTRLHENCICGARAHDMHTACAPYQSLARVSTMSE